MGIASSENDSSTHGEFYSDAGAEEQYRKERQYYENLRSQGLQNMPAIRCYSVIRVHLKNMMAQEQTDTTFAPQSQHLAAILRARRASINFADNLLTEIQEAISSGYTDIQLMPTSESGVLSLQDKVIASIYVTVVYQKPFTAVDMLDYEVSQADEEVIYMPHESEEDVEESREALNREAHCLKNRYLAGDDVIVPMHFEDYLLLSTDYKRLTEKGILH